MPRTSIQNKIIKDKRRDDILQASLELFVMNGFDSVSMDDIAKKVKCSHGLIYHYYSNKKEILIDIIKNCHRIMATDFGKILNSDMSDYDKFLNFMELILNSIKTDIQKRYYLFVFFTLPLIKSLSKEMIKPLKILELNFQKIISGCQEQGKFLDYKPKDFGNLIMNYCIGLLYSSIKLPESSNYINIRAVIEIISR